MPWLDNEAIAYIAQGFYILSAGRDDGLSEQAFYGYKVAQKYQTDEESAWVSALRNSLLTDPLYKKYIKKNFVGDGVEPPQQNQPNQNQPNSDKKERFYIVKPGDWLSKIAEKYYGDPMKYKVIHQANLRIIGPNPDIIKPGQRLLIP
jgi:nucleoid-associated protein YgaU